MRKWRQLFALEQEYVPHLLLEVRLLPLLPPLWHSLHVVGEVVRQLFLLVDRVWVLPLAQPPLVLHAEDALRLLAALA